MTHWLDEWNTPDPRLNRLVSTEDGSTLGVEKHSQTTGVVVPLSAIDIPDLTPQLAADLAGDFEARVRGKRQ